MTAVVGAPGLLLECGGALVGGGRHLAYGRAPFGLQGGDGGGDGFADLGVDALQLAQPRHVLGGGDRGESPQGEQRDDGHHQQGDDLRAYGSGARQPSSACDRGVRRASVRRLLSGVFDGGRPGVRASSAGCRRGRGRQRGRRRVGVGARGPAGCAHGLLVPVTGLGCGRRAG